MPHCGGKLHQRNPVSQPCVTRHWPCPHMNMKGCLLMASAFKVDRCCQVRCPVLCQTLFNSVQLITASKRLAKAARLAHPLSEALNDLTEQLNCGHHHCGLMIWHALRFSPGSLRLRVCFGRALHCLVSIDTRPPRPSGCAPALDHLCVTRRCQGLLPGSLVTSQPSASQVVATIEVRVAACQPECLTGCAHWDSIPLGPSWLISH